MFLSDFFKIYAQHPLIRQIGEWEKNAGANLNVRTDDTDKHLSVGGLFASARQMAAAELFNAAQKNILFVANDADAAGYAYFDIAQIIDNENVAFFPALYKKINKSGGTDKANEILRTDALNKINNLKSCITVTYPDALMEKVISFKGFDEVKIRLKKGQNFDMVLLQKKLETLGFEEVDFVYEPGQFSVRGSIIDVFSFANELPYRLDFFGDTIESVRTFDIEKQLSIKEVSEISIIPYIQNLDNEMITLFEFIPKDTIILFNSVNNCAERIDEIYTDALIKENEMHKTPDLFHKFINKEIFKEQISEFRIVEFSGKHFTQSAQRERKEHEENSALSAYSPRPLRENDINFETTPQPIFHKNFDLVANFFKQYLTDGYKIYISSDSKKQTDRIASIFEDRGDDIAFTPIEKTLHEGFIDNDLRICCFTDHQIFDRFHKFSLKNDITRRGKAAMLLKELNLLKHGDFVVHIDHGIGRFGGLLKTNINGKPQEVIKLLYKGDDIIFVSINSLHKIAKYKGSEGVEPTLSKLGTGAWERLKERTKNKVKDIARDLIKLYAQRLEQEGFSYSPDSYLQQELEASFIYEDTLDQSKATADIKQDMESLRPMDRLVCGDVGFGKTEVAIRAAFKAATDGKQVAVLVPTTVLAFQHYKTFSERLADFPVTIEYLSRAKSVKKIKEIQQKLSNGKIDILIGTHKIVGKEVIFKDLGLLIIDEEQKFGVAIKEKLKNLKTNVDTLTLTATPIPRTLQFSLMGARDLSIINTPPPNRYPVVTEIIDFDENTIREAIRTEMDRNGQIFFINNRVQSIYVLENKLKRLVPEARIAVAHGQMPPMQLENTILDFLDYEYDILLATTVIESGVDMPNVNTIFINHANSFGLSDLHQLRGRVGRSNRKAYCYLITPEFKSITEEARRRLQAIETFADLGSGFNISLQDLDIRGAGNMLGAEQSGFIAEMGYETYQKILAEAVQELRDEEFLEIFAVSTSLDNRAKNYVSECVFETDLDLNLPTVYVSSTSERIALYRELDAISEEQSLEQFKTRLTDRFGKIPEQADDLLKVLPLRWKAVQMGVERLVLKNKKMWLYLVSNPDSLFYQSEEFGLLLNYVSRYPKNCRIAESNNKRHITIEPVSSVNTALNVFGKFWEQ
ncbi:MAG: transcription-repair coupling factor [Prevotellaceae bacterium]|nr:transcription-repair coupling factor [Prevotellaceae bacterium]